jgi:hypothetical protein
LQDGDRVVSVGGLNDQITLPAQLIGEGQPKEHVILDNKDGCLGNVRFSGWRFPVHVFPNSTSQVRNEPIGFVFHRACKVHSAAENQGAMSFVSVGERTPDRASREGSARCALGPPP